MNKEQNLEKVKEMLGVEFNEPFMLRNDKGFLYRTIIYKLTENGLEVKEVEANKSSFSDIAYTLEEILFDGFEIVKEPFPKKPKTYKYWRYSMNGPARQESFRYDKSFYEDYYCGNFFATEKECEEKGPQLEEKLVKYFKENCKNKDIFSSD